MLRVWIATTFELDVVANSAQNIHSFIPGNIHNFLRGRGGGGGIEWI